MAKKDLSDYITTMKSIKPSAEVKSSIKDPSGKVTENVASREYVSKHAGTEINAARASGLSQEDPRRS
jgi:hypothetical protein